MYTKNTKQSFLPDNFNKTQIPALAQGPICVSLWAAGRRATQQENSLHFFAQLKLGDGSVIHYHGEPLRRLSLKVFYLETPLG